MIVENLNRVRSSLTDGVELVAVSKYHPVERLREAYDAGQRVFGESHVQELVGKCEALPKDVKWHFIGHLQTNKVKYLASFVSLIHAVDSDKLLKEINKQALKCDRVIDCLLQVHVADEETKFGFTFDELRAYLASDSFADYMNVRIVGLMAMATNTDDDSQIAREFESVKEMFDELKNTTFAGKDYFCELSMGMSGDYEIAMRHGSTMVRVGSMIFGEREYH